MLVVRYLILYSSCAWLTFVPILFHIFTKQFTALGHRNPCIGGAVWPLSHSSTLVGEALAYVQALQLKVSANLPM
jgi:hypothetical protein